MNTRLPNKNFWKNKKVLVTGHSGFKGSWLVIWLNSMGASVYGISLEPKTSPNLYSSANVKNICDSKFINICNLEKLTDAIQSMQPEIIIHMAAQSLVRRSYKEPINTFAVNVMGTVNILESIRVCDSVKTAVMITTDKVYKNNEDGKSYTEDDPLGGHDPYSASKAASEIVIESYRKSFFEKRDISISSARAGNVIGGGDWSEDRLIPDAIKSWEDSKDLLIRSPNSVRPWQHVLEPLLGYLILAEDTFGNSKLAGAYNFGPSKKDEATVKEVIENARKFYEGGNVLYQEDHSGPHEATLLSLNPDKAFLYLRFSPQWPIQETLKRTISWYKDYISGCSATSLCLSDIESYEKTIE
jgi:CDP-glucose 4,6-dehydratase